MLGPERKEPRAFTIPRLKTERLYRPFHDRCISNTRAGTFFTIELKNSHSVLKTNEPIYGSASANGTCRSSCNSEDALFLISEVINPSAGAPRISADPFRMCGKEHTDPSSRRILGVCRPPSPRHCLKSDYLHELHGLLSCYLHSSI